MSETGVAATDALAAYASRTDLQVFAPNALLLFALELRFDIDDIAAVAATAITDGKKDRKCDLMYIDEDSRVAVIAQGYEAADPNKAAAPSNKASDLATAATWIIGNERPADLEASLQTAAQELHDAIQGGEIDAIELWFSHNLAPSKNVEDELERVAKAAKDILRSRYGDPDIDVRAQEISRKTLDTWYQSARSPILVTDSISVPATDWFHEAGDAWEAVCTSVPATWLHQLYEMYGDRLFSANVRGYMPLRRSAQNINYGIEQTAKSSPRRFWAFNNGVTALVHDIRADRDAPELQLGGIAVVNGAQTTGSLGRVDPNALSDVRVLIRFVKATNSELIQDIIRYNNSQNQIKPSDFRSGDIHQSRLRNEFKGIPDSLYLGARRGGPEDRARKPSNLIPSDTAAQALAAFHQEPGIAYHDLRSIWENNDVYARFFGEHTTAEHVVFCYSLWLAVAYAKSSLTATPQEDQTQDIRDALEFLRKRGSLYLLVSAIAGSAEIYLSKALTDTFALSFGAKVSPAQAVALWEPLVDALLPLAPGQLSSVFGNGGLRRKEIVDSALKSFRAVVAATKRGNAELFEEFRSHVV
ncbi:AIPR family protein [Micromonospora sp. WMMD730]|uniref:AIPR family protein n=1 Tax=Micromonospora sp. WMMD730 TaxID=3404128 RepID=UPI003B94250C